MVIYIPWHHEPLLVSAQNVEERQSDPAVDRSGKKILKGTTPAGDSKVDLRCSAGTSCELEIGVGDMKGFYPPWILVKV